MKWIFGRTAMWIWATLALATMAFAAVQDPPLPEGDGKKILQAACTACHGLDGVVRLHLDKAGWEGLVSSMVSNGAQVDGKDMPVLIDYLVKNFGPAQPAGQQATQSGGASDADAKKILENNCTTCHDLDLVASQKLSKVLVWEPTHLKFEIQKNGIGPLVLMPSNLRVRISDLRSGVRSI